MKFDYKCNFDLEDCIRNLGLDEKGRVQQVIDHTFLMGVKPFTPFATGALYDSAVEKTVIGTGEIVFDADNKARRLYYHPEYNFSQKGDSEKGGMGRGGYWAERYIQNGGRDAIQQVAREAVK